MAGSQRRAVVTFVLAFVGGAAIVGGCFLAWLDVGQSVSVGNTVVSQTPKGNELVLGLMTLGAGVATLVFSLLLLLLPRARRIFGLLIFAGGLVVVGSALYALSFPKDLYANFAAGKGPVGHEDEVRASVFNLYAVSALQADPGVGLYVVVGGGAVAMAAGLVGLFGRRRPTVSEGQPVVPTPIEGAFEEGIQISLAEPVVESASTQADERQEAREVSDAEEPARTEEVSGAGEPTTTQEVSEPKEPAKTQDVREAEEPERAKLTLPADQVAEDSLDEEGERISDEPPEDAKRPLGDEFVLGQPRRSVRRRLLPRRVRHRNR